MSTFEEVGVVIHVLRVVRGLSQGDLARLSGVRNSSISNYERGKSMPKLETLEKLAQGLELPVSAMEETQEFIRRMRNRTAGSGLSSGFSRDWGLESGSSEAPADSASLGSEMDRLSRDAGRVTTQILRLALGMLALREEGGEERTRASDADSAEDGAEADHSPTASQSRGIKNRS